MTTTLQIKTLSVNNALCFDKLDVDFCSSSVTQIIGENGVGKSSIPTLLEEVLYNKNSRGLSKGDLLNRYSEGKEFTLTCIFDKGSDTYKVNKQVKSSAKVILTKNGDDISGHTATQTYKLIQDIIGLDFATFTKLIYQSMESSLDFLKATDANRKKFFMGLFNLSEYSETEEKLKSAYTSAKKELDTAKTQMDTVSAWLKQQQGSITRQEKIEVTPLDIESLEAEVTELNILISNIDRDNKDAERESLKRAHLERVQKLNVAPCNDNSEELKLSVQAYNEQNTLVSELKAEERISKAAEAKASKYNETCPMCGHELEFENAARIHKEAQAQYNLIKDKLEKALSKLTHFQHSKNECQIEYDAYRKYKKYCEDLKQAEDAIDLSKPTQIQDVDDLKATLSKTKLEIQMRKDDYESDIRHNNSVDINNAKFDAQEAQTVKYRAELKEYSEKLNDIKEIESDLKILKESFSGKGLVNFKIESLIKSFEEEINSNLVKLTDGQFALSFNIEDSKLKLKMYSHGSEVSIKSLSTGEFNKVNMSSLLAVRNMMSKLSDVSVNLLFLDEVISVLSDSSLETLIEHLLKENLNTFIVSHGYAHPLAEEIHLIKHNNISKVT